MPDLRLKEVRLPELHLPEMSRDDIVRAIGDASRDVDLARLDPRRMDMPDIDLSRVDIPKAMATAAQAAALVRTAGRPRIPRLPLVIGGLITVGLVGFALLNSPRVKPRITELGRRAKARIDEQRARRLDLVEEASVVVDAAAEAADDVVAIAIEPSAYADATDAVERDEIVAAAAETTSA